MIIFKNIASLHEAINDKKTGNYIALAIKDRNIQISDDALHRYYEIAESSQSPLVYSYYRLDGGKGDPEAIPLIEYQGGSLRDDFDFGGLVLLRVNDALEAMEIIGDRSTDPDGGWYALRLALSETGSFRLLPEYLYTMDKTDFRKSGEKQHDYVNPLARDYQIAMERIVTEYLERTGGLAPKSKKEVNLSVGDFRYECSVIIPVRNRVKTIGDAVKSALSQECDFLFNVIVVDNGSNDGTRELLEDIHDPRLKLVKVEPEEMLGIGGCWNRGIDDCDCGRFAVQLDSDDVYSSTDTLQKIVEKFKETRAGMVIGSYTMTDFDMNVLAPGLIAHTEWTDDNGANNALRINGLGAPRAFFTPLIREIRFPNVSYGEDYGVSLRISRDYKIGRIYDSLYLCRRWGGNSDAALDIRRVNDNNYYKDFLRTTELACRRRINGNGL